MTLALVTGAARGIGRAIAERLRHAGHDLVLVDLNPDVVDTATELDGVGIQADIAATDGVAQIRDEIRSHGSPLGVLVNNAGITRDTVVHKMSENQFRAVVRTNLGSVYRMTETLSELIVDGGSVVNLSSRAQLGSVGQFNYAVSKAGVIGCTRAHALTLAPRVRVNAVAPGFIQTAMTDKMPAEARERVVASVPLERAGQPLDIAETVAWLASPAAGYITGQVVYVCGGRSYA